MKRLIPSFLTLAFTWSVNAVAPSATIWKPEKGGHYKIYLCVGQSNMDGRAKAADLVGDLANYTQPRTDVLIRYSTGGLRRKLRTSDGFMPLRPGCSESPAWFGPELAFGHAIADSQPGKKILLIKVAEGGTNLYADWNPAAPKKLYALFLKAVRETQNLLKNEGATGEIAGMIWMQGESDSGKGHEEKYQEHLTAFIDKVREDLKAKKMPFVIGQICAANPAYQKVIAAQKAIAQTVPSTALASSVGLKTSDKATHFNAASQIELGKRFATELLTMNKAHSL